MPTITKIQLENFESHEYSEVELSNGITVIVGRNDCGKSSIVRALRWVIQNQPRGSEFLRKGASACSVTLTLDNGTIITRFKGNNRNGYCVQEAGKEPIEYNSVGDGVPAEVDTLLGIGDFVLPGETSPSGLNFSEQGSAPFGTSESGPERARRLAAFCKVDQFDTAIRVLNMRVRDNDKAIRILEKQKKETEETLGDFEDIKIHKELLGKLEELIKKTSSLSGKLQTLQQHESSLKTLASKVIEYRNKESNLDSIQSTLDFEKLEEQLTKLKALEKLHKDLEANTVWFKDIREREKTIVYLLEQCPNLVKADDTLALLSALDKQHSSLRKFTERTETLKTELAEFADRETTLTENYASILDSLGVCPTCFSVINPEDVKAGFEHHCGGE